MDKKELRQSIKSRIRACSEAALEAESAKICADLEQKIMSLNPKTVLLYWSLPDEVETHCLVQRLCANGIRVVLPVVEDDNLVLREFGTQDKMKVGAYGIMEPGEKSVQVPRAEIELAVVPGVAFTSTGKRLGRGKGFYDRLLPDLDCPKIGICFSCQILEDLPMEEHDAKVDEVCSF